MNAFNLKHGLKIGVVITLMTSISHAATYRWVDSNGKTHYSSSVPPSDAQLGHAELRKNGILKKVVRSAKDNREYRASEIVRIKQKKLAAKIKKEKDKQEEEEIQLLSIFSSEDEVINTYNAKLRMAQMTIDLLQTRHKRQAKRLGELERKQEQSKNIDHKHTYNKQIDVAIDNLSIYQQAITENLLEKDRVQKEFKTTLNKFKKLMAKLNQATN